MRRRHIVKMPLHALRGVWELARARIKLARLNGHDVIALNSRQTRTPVDQTHSHHLLLDRVGFVIPLAGRYVPWKSDCLVQAVAAQNWLAAHNLQSEIQIGADVSAGRSFEAHAWLIHDDAIIVGGEVSRFKVLVAGQSADGPGRKTPD